MIDFSRSADYTLSIRVSADGFCFAVHHSERAGDYAFMPYEPDPTLPMTVNLRRAVEQLPMLQHTYGQTMLLLPDAPCTPIPTEFFDESSINDCYALNFGSLPPHSTILANTISDGQVRLIHAVDHSIVRWANDFCADIDIRHSLQPILSYLLLHYASCFVVNLHERKADVICIVHSSLQYIGTFDNTSANDIAYYVLSVWKQLDLSQEEDILTLTGRASNLKDIESMLQRFVRHVELLQPSKEFHKTELARLDAVPFDIQALISL